MVFFSCEGCNETLKKAQVENHVRRCGCPVSCVDCSKVFPGVTYQQHTSCISEAEKYEKSLYKGPKGGGKKKRDPQAEWMDLIAAAAAEMGNRAASAVVRNNLQRMSDLGNVPRNEKKFKNFLSNSLRVHRPAEQDELWQFLRKRLEAATTAATAAAAAAAANGNGHASPHGAAAAAQQEQQQQPPSSDKKEKGGVALERGKKRKEAGASSSTNGSSMGVGEHKTGKGGGGGEKKKQKTTTEERSDAFAWEKAIKRAVKAAARGGAEGGIGLKALQRQVVAAAMAAGAGGGAAEKKALKKLFKTKVYAVPGVVVREDDTVTYSKKAVE